MADYVFNISYVIGKVEELGYQVVLIIMNPGYEKEMCDQLENVDPVTSEGPIQEFHGIKVIIDDKVKDFFVVTNESWAEQILRY